MQTHLPFFASSSSPSVVAGALKRHLKIPCMLIAVYLSSKAGSNVADEHRRSREREREIPTTPSDRPCFLLPYVPKPAPATWQLFTLSCYHPLCCAAAPSGRRKRQEERQGTWSRNRRPSQVANRERQLSASGMSGARYANSAAGGSSLDPCAFAIAAQTRSTHRNDALRGIYSAV